MKTLLLLISIVLLTHSILAADPFWSAYRTELVAFFKGGSSTDTVQLLSSPISANYDIDPQSQSLDKLMNQISKSGPVRSIVKDTSLPIQYYDFISNLKLEKIDEEIEKQVEDIKDNISAKYQQIEEEEPNCESSYQMFKSIYPTLTYETHRKTNCYRLNRYLADLAILQFELKQKISSAPDADIREALSKFDLATDNEAFPWKERISALSTFRRRIISDNLNTFQISISKSKDSHEQTESEWDIIDNAFIENGKGKSFSLSKSSDTFNLDIRAAGFYTVNVEPGDWFSQSVIDAHKKGPFVDSSIAKDFFGNNKKLKMIPNKLYLIYNPEIVLTVSSADLEYFETTPTIKIGPFSGTVESITEVMKDKSTSDESVYKILVQTSDENPLIVAVDNYKISA